MWDKYRFYSSFELKKRFQRTRINLKDTIITCVTSVWLIDVFGVTFCDIQLAMVYRSPRGCEWMCRVYDEKVSCFYCIYLGHIKLVLNARINVFEARNKRSLIYESAVRAAFFSVESFSVSCCTEKFFDYGLRSNFFNRFILLK